MIRSVMRFCLLKLNQFCAKSISFIQNSIEKAINRFWKAAQGVANTRSEESDNTGQNISLLLVNNHIQQTLISYLSLHILLGYKHLSICEKWVYNLHLMHIPTDSVHFPDSRFAS